MPAVNYVNGVVPGTARKIGCYVFGEYYVDMVENKKERTFDFFLRKGANEDEIKRFKKFWGGGFRIFIYAQQN